MNWNHIKEKIIISIAMYFILISISFYYYYNWDIGKYASYITLWLLIIIIKDILLYFISFEKVTIVKNSLVKLKKNYKSWLISFGEYYLFMNRNYFFPGVLIGYLIFILLHQIDLLDFLSDSIYTLINTNFLWIVVVSWVFTTFKEDFDNNYQRKVKSYEWLYKNMIINSVLSIIWSMIILMQTKELWFLSYIISLISGLLIFLVGVSIMEEDTEDVWKHT
jgi:hypothetical protein